MRPHCADSRRPNRESTIDFGNDVAECSRLSRDGRRGIHDDNAIRLSPYGEVGATVAGIVEPLLSVAAHKLFRSLFALKIARAI